MAPALRIATLALVAFCALALPAAEAARASAGARASIGFEPVPLSLAADGAGHVYLSAPQYDDSIQQYSSDGQPLASLGEFGKSAPPFQRDIATDAAGNLYVADSGRDEVVVLAPDGSTLRRWSGEGRDIAVDAAGTTVYLAGSHEIQRFAADGTLLSRWGTSGDGDAQFGSIWGLDTSPSGLVYVADTYGNRIQAFAADGGFLAKWGSYGSTPGQFIYPYGIATDAAGDVYVADTANARVQKFSGSGALLTVWGGPGRGRGRFFTPTSIATDPAGDVYVADMGEPYPFEDPANPRVQKFTPEGQFLTQWRVSPDATPGRPRLLSAPAQRTRKRLASFRFASKRDGVHFQCRLSGESVAAKLGLWRGCSSPQRYRHLRPGRKVFHVRAISGIWIGREAHRSWLIVSN